MISSDHASNLPIWQLLTRLGESQILLPAALLTMLVLVASTQTRRLALRWMALIIAATVITTASKIAFIGWGIGWAAIDYTGVSGHAMFATAIYPVLLVTFLTTPSRGNHRLPAALGFALAFLVGVSRIEVSVHSWSEVLAGWAVGGAVSTAMLTAYQKPPLRIGAMVPVALLAWMAIMPFQLHASPAHALVTRLALSLSGNENPFTRSELMRRAALERPTSFQIEPSLKP